MSGMSNACFRVEPITEDLAKLITPKTLLYRVFECRVIDHVKEAIVFQSMSEQGLGPKFCGGVAGEYRIESFFHGRSEIYA